MHTLQPLHKPTSCMVHCRRATSIITPVVLLQVTSPVLWENTIQTLLAKGVTKSYEIGPNKVIAGIIKRMDKAANIVNISA